MRLTALTLTLATFAIVVGAACASPPLDGSSDAVTDPDAAIAVCDTHGRCRPVQEAMEAEQLIIKQMMQRFRAAQAAAAVDSGAVIDPDESAESYIGKAEAVLAARTSKAVPAPDSTSLDESTQSSSGSVAGRSLLENWRRLHRGKLIRRSPLASPMRRG